MYALALSVCVLSYVCERACLSHYGLARSYPVAIANFSLRLAGQFTDSVLLAVWLRCTLSLLVWEGLGVGPVINCPMERTVSSMNNPASLVRYLCPSSHLQASPCMTGGCS